MSEQRYPGIVEQILRMQLPRLFAYIDMRRHIHDDEHNPPPAVHGSSLYFKLRVPIAAQQEMARDWYRPNALRERMSKGSEWIEEGINNEEGA